MKRSEIFAALWKESYGILKSPARAAIVGGGISGLHLAKALAERSISVTVFEPLRSGGVRIPLMHACHTIKVRAPLWETAAAFSRAWYRREAAEGAAIFERPGEFGPYFNICARAYIRRLRFSLEKRGVIFINNRIEKLETLSDYDFTGFATGAATQLVATRTIPGWESYFSRFGAPAADANIGQNGNKITNYIHLDSRAGFIHRNGETAASAQLFARNLHPTGRHALFFGERLTTRDRFPVVGFAGARGKSPFLFCGMGYHAMTYAPYLAHAAANQLTGGERVDENLICTLTPARFLPRSGVQQAPTSHAAP